MDVEVLGWAGALVVLEAPGALMKSAKSRVASAGAASASRACVDWDVLLGFAGRLVKRVESGMCLGDSIDLVREIGIISPVALEETDARERCFSSPGGDVVFRKSARSEVSAVSERGIGRLGESGKVISLTLRGVSVKWMVSSLLINLSKSAISFSESPLPPDARLVSDELRRRSDGESPCGRPMRPFSFVDTCDVVEPAVTGRLVSRALPKLEERRVLVWMDEETEVAGRLVMR
jgi:hypothetical protein